LHLPSARSFCLISGSIPVGGGERVRERFGGVAPAVALAVIRARGRAA
jgi:hypothetical protein